MKNIEIVLQYRHNAALIKISRGQHCISAASNLPNRKKKKKKKRRKRQNLTDLTFTYDRTETFSTFGVRPGINHASCPTEPIQAEEGDDVTLQCHVDHSVNLTKYTLDFTRADLSKKIVHAYRHGKDDPDPQMSEYRGRTTLIHADLSRGNMTLLISSVQMSDTGQYRCFVLDLAASCTIVLNVVKKDKDNRREPSDFTTMTPLDLKENPGAEEEKRVGAIVGGVLGVVALVILIIIGVLVKLGIIQKTRGARNQGRVLGDVL
ncbi:sodium channel subunit beta-4 [Lates calcarifer]|uniref:Sodium channel subunit beta-4 n=2 Tax=Lates calcarifer TaxID=8187 RepID=A0AAJ8DMM4_LATCA|nr:sodium channel subunit beta-4 [Lates calcarifer]